MQCGTLSVFASFTNLVRSSRTPHFPTIGLSFFQRESSYWGYTGDKLTYRRQGLNSRKKRIEEGYLRLNSIVWGWSIRALLWYLDRKDILAIWNVQVRPYGWFFCLLSSTWIELPLNLTGSACILLTPWTHSPRSTGHHEKLTEISWRLALRPWHINPQGLAGIFAL